MALQFVDRFFSALLSGLLCGIGIYAYISLQKTGVIFGVLVIAGVFFCIEALGLKLFIHSVADMVSKKSIRLKVFGDALITLIGNALGTGCIGLLFTKKFGDTAHDFYSSQFLPTNEKLYMHIFFGFLAGLLLCAVHFLYNQSTEKGQEWFLFLFLATALSATRIDFVLFDFFTITAAQVFTANSMRILLYLLLGNFFGAVFFSASYQLLDDPLKEKKKKIAAETQTEHHHHHTEDSASKSGSASASSAEIRHALKKMNASAEDETEPKDEAEPEGEAEPEENTHHHHHHHHSDSEHHHHHHSDSEHHHHHHRSDSETDANREKKRIQSSQNAKRVEYDGSKRDDVIFTDENDDE